MSFAQYLFPKVDFVEKLKYRSTESISEGKGAGKGLSEPKVN